jgi:signal transduction histidine kinase/FixJ family two-component response regulator
MNRRAAEFVTWLRDAASRLGSGKLFRKYVSLFIAVVAVALLTNGAFEIWFSYQEDKASLGQIQREQAEAAAAKIAEYIENIKSQLGWTTQLSWTGTNLESRRFDALRLLRQVPAITELAELDSNGHEQLRVSRLAMDVVGTLADFSKDPKFTEAMAREVYYGPVYFRRESEPYMTLSLAGTRRDAGVSVAEVNLKLIWEVISHIKVGEQGKAYLVDAQGRLIADPDISLVLRNTDLSSLMQVKAARASGADTTQYPGKEAVDLGGRRVLTAYAPVTPLGWTVFVELPLDEAYAPLYASMLRTGVFLAVGLLLAVIAGLFLARRMVVPIQTLRRGAARIGSGDLGQRISIKTGDELETLGDQFNSMAAQLQESYGTLENKVEERTQQLELANAAKSRFLAAASHDLRQPLHALGLFIAQLRAEADPEEKDRLLGRIDAAVIAMSELFNALLDISKLDGGILAPNKTDFPVALLLKRIEATFVETAREKGLRLRVVPSNLSVRSDFILLERILLNLVSNAARYTKTGGIVIGCRRRGAFLRIDVCDSGIGIPDDQQQNIFSEFYQIAGPERSGNHSGLGLGLAIVDRLGRLLDHPIELTSRVGRGSRFSVSVPIVTAPVETVPVRPVETSFNPLHGKSILVIDDDERICESMQGLLHGWGCRVTTADSGVAALSALADRGEGPDLIVCDYRLANGLSGIVAIEQVRRAIGAEIPAILVTGDTAPERLRDASESGFQLLHKPVPPMTLRALLSRLLRDVPSNRQEREGTQRNRLSTAGAR